MPANPQHLHEAFRRIGSGLAATQQSIQAARKNSLRMLREVAAAPERVAAAVNEAASIDAGLRCALPLTEDISLGYSCPEGGRAAALLAVDGSQVIPDRHEELAFAVINIGSVILEPGSGAVPQISTETRVLFGDELYAASGRMLSEGDLSLIRDSAERRSLLGNAPVAKGVIALSDGPLELWGAKDASDPSAFEQALRRYLDGLRELQRRGCTVAGYVDKPGADLVVRMLELAQPGETSVAKRDSHPLREASDRWLFGRILRPGERSALFALQSSSRQRYTDDLAIHFFYLNVGRQAQPALARVEVPGWVAGEPERIASVHRALLEQCAFLGARPYPYILHRAHETARISVQEKEQIKLRLLLELRGAGVEPEPVSGKSSAKSIPVGSGRK